MHYSKSPDLQLTMEDEFFTNNTVKGIVENYHRHGNIANKTVEPLVPKGQILLYTEQRTEEQLT